MSDFSLSKALGVMRRTTPFVVFRRAVYFGIAVAFVLATGMGAGLGYGNGSFWADDGRLAGAAYGAAGGFGLTAAALYFLREYVLSTVRRGHITAFLLTTLVLPLHAETIPVFTPGDEGRPFVDVYASGLYSATCVDGAGCTCAALPLTREDVAVTLGLEGVAADIQGIWNSPASDHSVTTETAEALHARFGGSGYCPQTALEPVDGRWRDGKPFNITVICGPMGEMFRQVLADQKLVTAAIVWNGVFSGDTIQTAFMAADPDPEYTPHAFEDVTPVESLGTATAATEMGPMTSTGRMRLLTPRLFIVHWDVKGMTEMGACNWSTDQLVTWVGE